MLEKLLINALSAAMGRKDFNLAYQLRRKLVSIEAERIRVRSAKNGLPLYIKSEIIE